MVSAAYIEGHFHAESPSFRASAGCVLFLGCTALSGGAQAGWFDFGSDKPAAKPVQPEAQGQQGRAAPAANLDDSIRQAQMLRLAGNYPEAIKHLSQLMMVAADDPRVVSEYGKTLAAMGRASDAVNFLTRAAAACSPPTGRSIRRWAWPMTRSATRSRRKPPMNMPWPEAGRAECAEQLCAVAPAGQGYRHGQKPWRAAPRSPMPPPRTTRSRATSP